MQSRNHPGLVILLLIGISGSLIACGGAAGGKVDNPLEVMSDPDTSNRSRIKAIRQAALTDPDNPERIKTLKEIMTGRGGHEIAVRIEAFNQLLEYDPEMARNTLFFRLPTIPSSELVEYLCQRIADEGWTEMTPSLIRSLSTGNPYLDRTTRPDGRALLRLHPGKSLSEIVMAQVVKPATGLLGPRWRMAAYELLHQLGAPTLPFHDWIANPQTLIPGDDFHAAIQNGYLQLKVVPETVEELRWLETIEKPEYQRYWDQCVSIVNAVPPSYQHDFGLRHLAVLTEVKRLKPAWFEMSRSQHYQELAQALRNRRHFYSGRIGGGGAAPSNPQRLEDWEDRLQWADLLAIRLADLLIRDPSIRSQIFTLVQEDRSDTATEYGGILDVGQNGAVELRSFPPYRVANDTRYHSSDAMVTRGYTAPFHFHFHVQEILNRKFAGPGSGDRNYADIMRVNAIVLTSIDENTLNVDYYQEGRIVVDLGLITK